MEEIIIAGGNIIEKNKKFLLIQETLQEVKGQWNFPLGRVEMKEDIITCTKREGEEETGLKLKPLYLVGIYQHCLTAEYNVVLFMFKSKILRGKLKTPKDIMDARWFSFSEIEKLNKKGLLVSSYILKALRDFKAGKKLPLRSITILKKY